MYSTHFRAKPVNVNAGKAIGAVLMLPGGGGGVHDGVNAGPNKSEGTYNLSPEVYNNTLY